MTVRSSAWLLAALVLLPQTRAAEASSARQVLVTSAADAGPGTFRAAIARANADPDVTRVVFTGRARTVALARDGDTIRDGVDPELDELRRISRSGKQIIAELEAAERTRTGITSLKVRFNRVFGYYIEISKSNLHAVPDDYIRKQTIAGGERFVTPALKSHEEKAVSYTHLTLPTSDLV